MAHRAWNIYYPVDTSENSSSPALVQAAVTNNIDNELLFLKVLKAGKSEIKVPADSMSGESLFPG